MHIYLGQLLDNSAGQSSRQTAIVNFFIIKMWTSSGKLKLGSYLQYVHRDHLLGMLCAIM